MFHATVMAIQTNVIQLQANVSIVNTTRKEINVNDVLKVIMAMLREEHHMIVLSVLVHCPYHQTSMLNKFVLNLTIHIKHFFSILVLQQVVKFQPLVQC